MEIFTLEEYEIIAKVIDTWNVDNVGGGTIHTLPPLLSKLTHIRVKLQGLIEAVQKEYVANELSKQSVGVSDTQIEPQP